MTRADAVSEDLASMLRTCAVCRLWAEQDEGPYHRDAQPAIRFWLGPRMPSDLVATPPTPPTKSSRPAVIRRCSTSAQLTTGTAPPSASSFRMPARRHR